MARKFRYLALATLFAVLLISAPAWGMGERPAKQPGQPLTILHTNDIHGHFMGQRATWLKTDSPPLVGGVAALATYCSEVRKNAHQQGRGLLILDAGDWFTGTPESDLNGGKPMITGLNQLNYDFTTIGNHEFDVGTATLKKRIHSLDLPVLAANILTEAGKQFPGTRPWAVKQVQGVKIGIFGLIVGPEMKHLVKAGMIEGTSFKNSAKMARRAVRKLRKKSVDLIIGLTHQGLKADKELARQVAGIDLIIGGHSHSRVDPPLVVGKTIVAQAGDALTSVGRLDLWIDLETGQIRRFNGDLVSLRHKLYPPDTRVKQALAPYRERMKEKLSVKIGHADVRLSRDSKSSSRLGNLITDAMRRAVGADVAFQNSYGIRSEIPAGKITVRHLYQVLPFGNELVTMQLKGKKIRSIIEQGATLDKGLIQVSGARARINFNNPPGRRVTGVKLGGQPLEPEQSYKVVTNSFLAEGGDGFKDLAGGKKRFTHTGLTIRKALREYLEKNSPLTTGSSFVEDRYFLKNMPSRE